MKHRDPVVADIGRMDAPRSPRAARELVVRIVRGIYPARNFQDGFTVLNEAGQLHRCKVVYADPPARPGRAEGRQPPRPQQYFWIEVDLERRRLAAYLTTLARQLAAEPAAEEPAA